MLRMTKEKVGKSLSHWWHSESLSHAYSAISRLVVKWNNKCLHCVSPWFSTLAVHETHPQCLGHIPDQWDQTLPGGSQVSQVIPMCSQFWKTLLQATLVGYSVSGRKKKIYVVQFLIENIYFQPDKTQIPKMVKRSEPVCFLISFGSSICETFITLQLISTNTWMTGWDKCTVAVVMLKIKIHPEQQRNMVLHVSAKLFHSFCFYCNFWQNGGHQSYRQQSLSVFQV